MSLNSFFAQLIQEKELNKSTSFSSASSTSISSSSSSSSPSSSSPLQLSKPQFTFKLVVDNAAILPESESSSSLSAKIKAQKQQQRQQTQQQQRRTLHGIDSLISKNRACRWGGNATTTTTTTTTTAVKQNGGTSSQQYQQQGYNRLKQVRSDSCLVALSTSSETSSESESPLSMSARKTSMDSFLPKPTRRGSMQESIPCTTTTTTTTTTNMLSSSSPILLPMPLPSTSPLFRQPLGAYTSSSSSSTKKNASWNDFMPLPAVRRQVSSDGNNNNNNTNNNNNSNYNTSRLQNALVGQHRLNHHNHSMNNNLAATPILVMNDIQCNVPATKLDSSSTAALIVGGAAAAAAKTRTRRNNVTTTTTTKAYKLEQQKQQQNYYKNVTMTKSKNSAMMLVRPQRQESIREILQVTMEQ